MEASLPTYAVFYSESAGKYLSYMSADGGGELNRIVAAKAKNVGNPRAKFEVVPSKVHPPMVHIRCSFHFKFLRRRSDAETWIVGAAEEQEEDLSRWSSTLFLPEFFDKPPANTAVRLLHVESGRYLQWYDGGGDDGSDPYSMCIRAQSTDPADPRSAFQVVYWDDLVTLPRHLSFLHTAGVKYLGIRDDARDDDALQFVEYDPYDLSFENEVVSLPDGSVYIRNVSRNAFWKVDTSTPANQVFANYRSTADVPTPPPSREILFKPIKADNSQLAFLHLGTNRYCTRDSFEIEDGLRASSDDMSDGATHLMASAALSSSQIEDIELDLDNAWLELQKDRTVLDRGVDLSNETGKTQIRKVEIPYRDLGDGEWGDTTFTFRQVGPLPEIEPDQVPYVTDSSTIETRKSTISYQWNMLKPSKLTPKVVVHEVTVPPMTMVTAMVVCSFASLQVPFSYTRRDQPARGQEEIYFMDDGRFVGRNFYNVRVEVSPPEPISITKSN